MLHARWPFATDCVQCLSLSLGRGNVGPPEHRRCGRPCVHPKEGAQNPSLPSPPALGTTRFAVSGDRDRPIHWFPWKLLSGARYLAHGETRDTKVGGFFLNAAGIGNHDGRAGLQPEEVDVGQRVEHAELAGLQPEIGDPLAGSGMRGKDDGQVAIDFEQGLQDSLERRTIVDIGGR